MIGREKTGSILDYNGIGFDMDHTFIRYKMRNFIELVYESTSIFLVSKRLYPQEIFPVDREDAKTKYRMFFRCVFDHQTGNLLKIGCNNLIMRAYHGYRPLSSKEIIDTYGKNPTITDYEILVSGHKDFTNLHEFYGAAMVPLIAQIVQLKSENKYEVLNNKNFYDIMKDIKDANEFNYAIDDMKAFKNKDYTGHFFPKFLTKPTHFINKVSHNVLNKLQKLREKGIPVFIASNSYYEVGDALMREAMGPNWLDYFDFVIYFAMKPAFFRNIENPKCFKDINGNDIEDFSEFYHREKKGEEKILLGGHANLISDFMKKQHDDKYKILFFGDTIVTDCIFAFDRINDKNWDVVLILEELQELEKGYKDGEYYNYCTYWGSALHDKNIYSGVDKTIVFDFADNIAHRCFSTLDSAGALEFLSI